MSIDLPYLRKLRLLSVVEACSTLALFGIAMPLKYVWEMPRAVTVVGSIHGLLFLALVAMFLVGRHRVPLSTGLTVGGIVGAVLPFGPFVVDHWLNRLARQARAEQGEAARAEGR